VSALASLDRANAASLEELRASGSDAPSLLIDLLSNACLLELSKLVTTPLDLDALCAGAVETLSLLAPIDRVAICVATDRGLRVARQRGFTSADIDVMADPDAHTDVLADGRLVYRVMSQSDVVFAALAAGGMPPELLHAGFFDDVTAVLGPAILHRALDDVIVLDQAPEPPSR
jgi:hypothetical protein